MGIVDHNTFDNNASGDIVLWGKMLDTSIIEYNHFSVGDNTSYNDGAFIPHAGCSYVLYRNVFEKPAPSGGCSGQFICTYGGLDNENDRRTFMVENEFPRQRGAIGRFKHMCIKGNTSHGGVLSFASIPDVHLLDNKIYRYEGVENLAGQGNCTYAIYKDSLKGEVSGNMVCNVDKAGKETCEEYTEINTPKENGFVPGQCGSTF